MSSSITIHALRYRVATHLLENGESTLDVQKRLGHAPITTTMIYLHVAALSRKFRGKFMVLLTTKLKKQDLKYIARYAFRVVITNTKILDVTDDKIAYDIYTLASSGRTTPGYFVSTERRYEACIVSIYG